MNARTIAIATFTLVAGVFVGALMRDAVRQAHAQAPVPFTYKLMDPKGLIQNVKYSNPRFKNANDMVALEEGFNGFGRSGWRYAGCLQNGSFFPEGLSSGGWGLGRMNAFMCDVLIFENAAGAVGLPPPAAAQVPVAPPPPPPPPAPVPHH
jgi:hypothetical protein